MAGIKQLLTEIRPFMWWTCRMVPKLWFWMVLQSRMVGEEIVARGMIVLLIGSIVTVVE